MNFNMRELMKMGAHIGHRTRYWNPAMKPFIYGSRNSHHIVNLEHTIERLSSAYDFCRQLASNRGTILFVCTKKSAKEAICEEARRCSMPYVNNRWLGGILTNFKTIRNSVSKLEMIEKNIENDILKEMTKKEAIKYVSMRDKLENNIGGIREMTELPDALFVIDAGHHRAALLEAFKLEIPVIAVVDTNNSPEHIDYVIPGNDDSRELIRYYAKTISNAAIEGREKGVQALQNELVERTEGGDAKEADAREKEAFTDAVASND
jgi:small subunit ribosomal protein S2